VTATVSNGIVPYSYNWTQLSGGAFTINTPTSQSTSFTASTLSATGETRTGSFQCVVTDGLGRTASATISVTCQRYAALTVSAAPGALSATADTSTITTATETMTVSGGSGSHTPSWVKVSGDAITAVSSGADATTFRGTSMLAGETRVATFKAHADDATSGQSADSANFNVTISRPAAFTASAAPASLSDGDTTATVTTTGSATCTPSGGSGNSANWSYSWTQVSGGVITAVSPTASVTKFKATLLSVGESRTATFNCVATDSVSGQTATTGNITITIQRYSTVTLSVSPSTLSQNGTSATITTTGSATATPSGGSGNFTYAWTKTSGGAITAVSASSATSKFKATGMANGESRTATMTCTVTDTTTGATATDTCSVTITNTTSSVTYSPVAGTYYSTDSLGVGAGDQYTITASLSEAWTWSASPPTGVSANIASGGTGTTLTLTLTAAAASDRSSTVTVTSSGQTWTINMSASAQSACPTVDTPIQLTASGMQKPAGQIVPGEFIYTCHEQTGEWGLYRVEAAVVVPDQEVYAITIDGKRLRATPDHRVKIGESWFTIVELGAVPDGFADVVKMTVADAHTMVTNGILSHNIKS
jgi:hypothetical protein